MTAFPSKLPLLRYLMHSRPEGAASPAGIAPVSTLCHEVFLGPYMCYARNLERLPGVNFLNNECIFRDVG